RCGRYTRAGRGRVSALPGLFARCRTERRAALIGYLPAGYPDLTGSAAHIDALIDGGADAVEVGMPLSGPVLAGHTLSTAHRPARHPGHTASAPHRAALIDGGADAVEAGMPFSDPVLDGTTISTAQRAALAAGFRTKDLFTLVERVAERGAVPVVMSYVNPVF